MSAKHYDTDGKPWDKPNHIPPIVLLDKGTEEYPPGWYHCDEVEQLHGPFSTLEEAAIAYNEYMEWL